MEPDWSEQVGGSKDSPGRKPECSVILHLPAQMSCHRCLTQPQACTTYSATQFTDTGRRCEARPTLNSFLYNRFSPSRRHQNIMRKPLLGKSSAHTSSFQTPAMASSGLIGSSGVDFEEEIKINIGDVEYLLILNQEVASAVPLQCIMLTYFRISSPLT